MANIVKHLLLYRKYYILLVAYSLNIIYALLSVPLGNITLFAAFSYSFFLIYGVLLVLSFPLRYVLGLVIFGLGLTSSLMFINERKIALSQLPLTYLDFKITLSNPEGFFNAIKMPGWIIYLLGVLVLIIVVIAAWIVVNWAYSVIRRKIKIDLRRLSLNLLLFVMLLVSVNIFLNQYVKSVKTFTSEQNLGWEGKKFSNLSRIVGIWGFLVYSYHLEQHESGDFFDSNIGSSPPTNIEIREAAKEFVNISGDRTQMKPNIVVVLGESTLNPSDIFRLSKPINNKLFEKNKYTQAIGDLYVNAVGGGTWITEFETITGIDSRLFGYAGYYTHSSLSPYVNETFVTYLKKHGYVTEAFYAIRGNFYNAINAYKNYGFDAFFEKLGGWVTKDEDLIDTVIELSNTEEKPFFKYIVTIGNHYPTKCENFNSKEQFVTTFKGHNEFNNANCVLNEYISELKSTEQAFLKLINYLEELEESTGRPFVLLIYGDHQPGTFMKESYGFQKFRTTKNERETFFHLVSSIPNVVKCCGETAPHATLMPTLLSAYVASDIDDIYLNINLFSFKNCGSDFMGNVSGGGYGVDFKTPPRTGKCSIYEKLLTAYRNSGVLNNF